MDYMIALVDGVLTMIIYEYEYSLDHGVGRGRTILKIPISEIQKKCKPFEKFIS